MSSATELDTFIGRERELTELTTALENAMDDRGGVVMLVGEPGIGKTRPTEELESMAVDRDARVVRGASFEGGSPPPFWPWIQILRSVISDNSMAERRHGDYGVRSVHLR